MYEPPLALPHRSQPFARTGYTLPEPLFEVELLPGDLLYLPRGYVHSATTEGSHAAHITLGVTVYTWVELLSEWVQASKDIPSFREALPVGFADPESSKERLLAGLKDRIDELRSETDFGAIVESFGRRVRSQQPRPPVTFRSDVSVIAATTELRTPEPATYAIGIENGNTTLAFQGKTLFLPAGVRPLLEAMCARGSFRLNELPKHLEDQATLAFAQYLEGERFLAIVRA